MLVFFCLIQKKKFTELASSSVSVYVDGERCCCASPKSVQLPEHTSFRINQIGSQNTHTHKTRTSFTRDYTAKVEPATVTNAKKKIFNIILVIIIMPIKILKKKNKSRFSGGRGIGQ